MRLTGRLAAVLAAGVSAAAPAALKASLDRFGASGLARSLLRLAVPAALTAGAAEAALRLVSPAAALMVTAAGVLALLLARGLDVAGRLLVGRAAVLDNCSEPLRARRWYAAAAVLLADAKPALLGILAAAPRVDRPAAGRPVAGRRSTGRSAALGALVRLAPSTRDPADALLVVEELCAAGRPAEALRYCRALPIRHAPAVAAAEARLLLAEGSPREAMKRLTEAQGDRGDELHAVRAEVLCRQGRLAEAEREIDEALRARRWHAPHLETRARILSEAGLDRQALAALDRSLFLHRHNPRALALRAALCERLGMHAAAHRSLRAALACDNMDTSSFLRLHAGRSRPLPPQADAGLRLSVVPGRAEAAAGETVDLTVRIESRRAASGCTLTALEPFGGGLEVRRRVLYAGRIAAGGSYEGILHVTGKRPSEVNLGRPWRLNVVLTCDDGWTSSSAEIAVRDPAEGEVHLVITNDHETAIRRERMEGQEAGWLTSAEALRDLAETLERAHEVSAPSGARWTHLLDAGTALGLMRWAAERSPRWASVNAEAVRAYVRARERSHDLQLHLHLSALPESYFFCYRLDPRNLALVFDRGKKERYFPGWQVNSWARVVPRFGPPSSPDSRLGSLLRARAALVELTAAGGMPRAPLLFRAGQWDFGQSPAERDISVLALREAGILADSSATSGGSLHSRRFAFGAPPSQACYYARGSEVTKPARELSECGLTEVVPVLLPQGRHPVTPHDDPRPVLRAYRRLTAGGAVQPGRHILMEIEHLADVTPAQWKAIERHLRIVSSRCPRMHMSGAAEALESWWDYYSPQVLALPAEPRPLRDGAGLAVGDSHRLRLLASSILCRDTRVVPVIVLLPPSTHTAPRAGRTAWARIMNGRRCLWHGPVGGRSRLDLALPLSEESRDSCRLELLAEARAARHTAPGEKSA